MPVYYKKTDKLSFVLANDYRLLQVMSRFGITLGFGEKTIEQVCQQCGVDTDTFLAVINYVKDGAAPMVQDVDKVSVPSLLNYLRRTHRYFLDYLFPHIRFHLLNAIDCSIKNEIAFLVLKFFDEYVEEVRKHMEYEEDTVFAAVTAAACSSAGAITPQSSLLSKHNEEINGKLRELKKLFIQYYPQAENNERLNSVIISIYQAEEDLAIHCNVEDYIFAPAVHRRHGCSVSRSAVGEQGGEQMPQPQDLAKKMPLGVREQEIVACVARGLSNKEIAEQLCLSVNTVTTHRRNIARKLQIHSPSGLTIYAIVNKLVTLSEVDGV